MFYNPRTTLWSLPPPSTLACVLGIAIKLSELPVKCVHLLKHLAGLLYEVIAAGKIAQLPKVLAIHLTVCVLFSAEEASRLQQALLQACTHVCSHSHTGTHTHSHRISKHNKKLDIKRVKKHAEVFSHPWHSVDRAAEGGDLLALLKSKSIHP